MTSCNAPEEFSPAISVDQAFTLSENLIYGKLVNIYTINPFLLIQSVDDAYKITLYQDKEYTKFFTGTDLDLEDGENTFYLLIGDTEKSKAYTLVIDCVMILDFEIHILEEKQYNVNDDFDRSTIEVIAKRENGTLITVTDYEVQFDASSSGETKLIVFYGGIQHEQIITIN